MNRLLPALLLILTATITAYPQTQTQTDVTTLEHGKLLEREISGGGMHAFNLAVPAGGYAHVDIDQRSISVSAVLLVDGKQVRLVDNTGGGDVEVFSLTPESDTTYRLELWAPDKSALPGKYTIVLKDSRPATEADKARVEGE